MFSGIIEKITKVQHIEAYEGGKKLTLKNPFNGTNIPKPYSGAAKGEAPRALPVEGEKRFSPGDSLAINGCCLTLTEHDNTSLTFQLGFESLDRCNLGGLQVGDVVNLERALKVDARLGGHMVSGHVDALGNIKSIKKSEDFWEIGIAYPDDYAELLVEKGSICVDGISLTVNCLDKQQLYVGIIKHTLDVTTLGHKQIGDSVNLEFDLIGKYVQKLVKPYQQSLLKESL